MTRTMNIVRRVEESIDSQYGRPQGLIGRLIGERMVRQHEVETRWAVSVLQVGTAERVLDIGCGAGRAVELIARRVEQGQVVGVDLSQTMIDAARRRNSRAIRKGTVLVRQGDALRLPCGEDQFDKILSIHSAYFWPDRERALAEILRVLKPGGVAMLVLSTGRRGDPASGWTTILEDQIVPEMKRLGFSAVRLVAGPDSRRFKIAAAMGTK